MIINKLKASMFFLALTINSIAYAVVERCEQSVNFNNGNTYKDISGQITCFLKSNPLVKTRIVTLNKGKKQGKTIIYAPFFNEDAKENQIMSKEHFLDDQEDGEFVYYDEDGMLKEESFYKAGRKLREKRMSPFKKGGWTLSFYRPNPKHSGVDSMGTISYTSSGQLNNITCPNEQSNITELDKVCGFEGEIENTLYDESGTMTSVTKNLKGKTVEQTEFNSWGKVIGIYSDDLKKFFYETGNLKKEIMGAAEQEQIVTDYYPTGKPKIQTKSKQRMITEMSAWYMNDKLNYNVIFHSNPDLAEATTYYGNGQLYQTYSYIPTQGYSEFSLYSYHNEKVVGQSKIYYKNGQLHEDTLRSDKGIPIAKKAYYETGQLQQTIRINSDEMRIIQDYDTAGQLKKTVEYYPDGSVK
ncbi:MAG: hypothetical protein V3U87_13575 [Methylococcaceae bacterium]